MIVENVILTMIIGISGVGCYLIVLNVFGGCQELLAQYEAYSEFMASDRRALEIIRRG